MVQLRQRKVVNAVVRGTTSRHGPKFEVEHVAKVQFSTVRSTAASGSMVYESSRAVSEYLLAHFGHEQDQMPYKFGPMDGTRFPERLASLCMKQRDGLSKKRAMDVGCAVGAVSFHLTRGFDDVVGIDFSQHFVDAANEMKTKQTMKYTILKQGEIFEDRVASLPSGVVPTKATFLQGDACNMDKSLGKGLIQCRSHILLSDSLLSIFLSHPLQERSI